MIWPQFTLADIQRLPQHENQDYCRGDSVPNIGCVGTSQDLIVESFWHAQLDERCSESCDPSHLSNRVRKFSDRRVEHFRTHHESHVPHDHQFAVRESAFGVLSSGVDEWRYLELQRARCLWIESNGHTLRLRVAGRERFSVLQRHLESHERAPRRIVPVQREKRKIDGWRVRIRAGH